MKFSTGPLITLVVILVSFLLPTTVTAVAKEFPPDEFFELVLEGDGYTTAVENRAFKLITNIFLKCLKGGNFKIKEQSRKAKRERLLRGQQQEDKQLHLVENKVDQGRQERELLKTCPNSCAGSTSSRCRRLCGSGGGRRLLEEVERQREMQSTIKFDEAACEAKMQSVLNKRFVNKKPGVTMKAYVLV